MDVEAIVVLVMVAITFGMVRSRSRHNHARNEPPTIKLGAGRGGYQPHKISGSPFSMHLILCRFTDVRVVRHYLVTWRSSRWQSMFLALIHFLALIIHNLVEFSSCLWLSTPFGCETLSSW